MVCTQIISKKKVDGFNKFITASDINSFKKVKNLQDIEDAIKACFEKVDAAVAANNLSAAQACGIKGRFCTRVVLMTLKKKGDFESKKYETLKEVNAKMEEEVASKSGSFDTAADNNESKKKEQAASTRLPTVAQASDKKFLAEAQGYKVNSVYYLRFDAKDDDDESLADGKTHIVTIFSMSDEKVVVAQAEPFEDMMTWDLNYDRLKKVLKPCKNPPFIIDQSILKGRDIADISAFEQDLDKAKAFQFLHNGVKASKLTTDDFSFRMHPMGIQIKSDKKVGSLKLYPLVQQSAMSLKPSSTSFKVCAKNMSKPVYIAGMSQPKDIKDMPKGYYFCPFFWVQVTEEEEYANMQIDDQGVMSNHKALSKDDVLKRYVPPKNKKAKTDHAGAKSDHAASSKS